MRNAATAVDPDPMNGSSTTSPSYVYSSTKRWGSSTGNGAGWPTRVALSGASSHTSRVASMNSSAVVVARCGRPSRWRLARGTARSNRPLDATITRSVRSRSTGLAGLRNDPHAQLPPAPRALRHTTSPRSKRPNLSCRMPMTSADNER